MNAIKIRFIFYYYAFNLFFKNVLHEGAAQLMELQHHMKVKYPFFLSILIQLGPNLIWEFYIY